MSLIFPDGFRSGCRPRNPQFRGAYPRFRDRRRRRDREDQDEPQPGPWPEPDGDDSPDPTTWDEITEMGLQPDLGLFLDRFKRQTDNSCAAESTAQAFQLCRKSRGGGFIEMNPLSLYHYTSGGDDRGSSIDDNLRYARDLGICPESVRSRSEGWKSRLSDAEKEAARANRIVEFLDVESKNEFAESLMLGFPTVFGWEAHAVVAVKLLRRYKSQQFFKAAGSWGSYVDPWERRYRIDSEFADYLRSEITPGYHLLELDEPEIDRYGAFAIRTVTWLEE
jgi:hypothetical protein